MSGVEYDICGGAGGKEGGREGGYVLEMINSSTSVTH